MKQCRRGDEGGSGQPRGVRARRRLSKRPGLPANRGPVVLSNNLSGGPLAADCGTSGGGARRNGWRGRVETLLCIEPEERNPS